MVINQNGPDDLHNAKVGTLVLFLWSLTRRRPGPPPTSRGGRLSLCDCTFSLFGASMPLFGLFVCEDLPCSTIYRLGLPFESYRRSPIVVLKESYRCYCPNIHVRGSNGNTSSWLPTLILPSDPLALPSLAAPSLLHPAPLARPKLRIQTCCNRNCPVPSTSPDCLCPKPGSIPAIPLLSFLRLQ